MHTNIFNQSTHDSMINQKQQITIIINISDIVIIF